MPCWPCARIGAIHSIVFCRFLSYALQHGCKVSDGKVVHHRRICAAAWQGYPAEATPTRALASYNRFGPNVCGASDRRAMFAWERTREMWIIQHWPEEATDSCAARSDEAQKTRCSSSTTSGLDRRPKGVVPYNGRLSGLCCTKPTR